MVKTEDFYRVAWGPSPPGRNRSRPLVQSVTVRPAVRSPSVADQNVCVQIGGEKQPENVRGEQGRSRLARPAALNDVGRNERIEDQDVDESCQRATEIEKGDAPCEVEKKLDAEQSDQSFFPGRVAAEDQSGRNADAQINDRPCDRERDVRRCQGRLVEQRVPVLDGVRLDSAGDEPQQEADQYGNQVVRRFFSFSGSFLPLMCNNRAQRLGFSGRTGMRSHMSRA